MSALAIEATRTRQSGRKASRTDYVYVVSVHFAGSVTNLDVTRTLTSARQSVRDFAGLKRLPVGKIGRNDWLGDGNTDFAGRRTYYTVQRRPLHN
jgi:hypothetical protein